jgi:hypothetical protein
MDMHTINDLRKLLGLTTTNQVRNRIEAIKDVLPDHLRRGPNNQILITEGGVELLRRLQNLYDSGLTITEASEVIRSSSLTDSSLENKTSSGFVQKHVNVEERDELIAALKEEIAFLRERVAFLEQRKEQRPKADRKREWWEKLREEV